VVHFQASQRAGGRLDTQKNPHGIQECEVSGHRKNGWYPVPGSKTGVFSPRQCLVYGRYAVRLSQNTQYFFNPLHS